MISSLQRVSILASIAAALAFGAPAAAQEACSIDIKGTTYDVDLKKGKRAFIKCKSCHTLAPGGRNMVGPNLGLLFEREALSAEKFKYSPAFQEAAPKWDYDMVDSLIEKPRTYIPKSKMLFVGVRKPQERADIIAYLRQETNPEFSCDADAR